MSWSRDKCMAQLFKSWPHAFQRGLPVFYVAANSILSVPTVHIFPSPWHFQSHLLPLCLVALDHQEVIHEIPCGGTWLSSQHLRTLRWWEHLGYREGLIPNNNNQNAFVVLSLCFLLDECLPEYMFMHHLHAWCLQWPEEGIKFSDTRVTDGYESSWRCWKSHQVL